MESLIIPGILGGAALICYFIFRNSWDFDIIPFIAGGIAVITLIICPIVWAGYRNAAIEAQSYYENIVDPHIIEEYEDYVIVGTDIAPAIWQAGESNLAIYNGYLKSARYWDSVPIIGSVVYPPPSELKFVRVQPEGRTDG